MKKNDGPSPLVDLKWRRFNEKGDSFVVEVEVTQTEDFDKFAPDGIRAIFRVLKDDNNGESRLVVLIDNHKPLGFHVHDKLPDLHDSREKIQANSWQEAWSIFEEKMQEIFK